MQIIVLTLFDTSHYMMSTHPAYNSTNLLILIFFCAEFKGSNLNDERLVGARKYFYAKHFFSKTSHFNKWNLQAA